MSTEPAQVAPFAPRRRPHIVKSTKLADVCYEIRGPVLAEANRLEEEGHRILKLNIGNPAPFGFHAPEELLRDVIHNVPASQGYCESKGLYSARKAVMQDCQRQGIANVDVDDITIGNGVSELIAMSMQALLNDGDEMLLPAPDYPLWTAVVKLSGGVPVHYRCDEADGWAPDLDDIRAKTTNRTRGIVVINPNNPTGAVYSRATLESITAWARQRDLVQFADEIYARIVYDDAVHHPLASLSSDVLTVTFNGLSKAYRVAGFRTGWMVVSGPKERARDYMEGLDILASMRLCANVPTQHAIQGALGGHQSIEDHTAPGGSLYEQRRIAHSMLNQIEGVSCVEPGGALYAFPRLDRERFGIVDDERFVLDLLRKEKILVVQGSAFNIDAPDHFRLVFLPRADELTNAIARIGDFLATYRQ
ncbi:MAG: pyridoxal phosphate-dependent aminotransferase [Pseudomonadales bacterium]|nr:pyridoxal phosphate-dependent aminotransferase [Pseudomonadales bacterium]